MKRFNNEFKTRLYSAIQDIENNSLVEIVVIIKAASATYREAYLWWGVIFAFLIDAFFMFSPAIYEVPTIFFGTILSFLVGFVIALQIDAVQRIVLSKKQLTKNAEIAARAIFQKGGIRHTNEKTGVLIYFSLFEKKAFIVPDRKVELSVPEKDMKILEEGFQSVFYADSMTEAILTQLKNCIPVFSNYVPPIENDINELPDDLDVDL